MTNQYIGWSAMGSAIFYLLVIVTSVLFYSLGGVFGPINDLTTITQFILALPVVYGLYKFHRRGAPSWATLTSILGFVGVGGVILFQAILVARLITFEQQFPLVLSAGIVVGLWLMAINVLAVRQKSWSRKLASLGLLGGVGYILTAVGFFIGDQNHPLVGLGFLLSMVGYVGWGIGVGRWFSKAV